MKGEPEERAILLGEYITETGATVRDAARRFGLSKSTVHKDITERLSQINPSLAGQPPLWASPISPVRGVPQGEG